MVPLAWFLLNKTTFGLNLKAVGENPEAADTLGIDVIRMRYMSLMIGGALSGIAALSIALLNVLQQISPTVWVLSLWRWFILVVGGCFLCSWDH
ncbi:MAG: hypothetical protein R2865_09635 [Deinococcales bacterium]